MRETFDPQAERRCQLEELLRRQLDLRHEIETRLAVVSDPMERARLTQDVEQAQKRYDALRAEYEGLPLQEAPKPPPTAGIGEGKGAEPLSASPFTYDVFVSYRRQEPDKTFVYELVGRLEAEGYKVAIDERDFRADQHILNEMERCVKESRFTLAIVSARYLESGNTDEELVICKTLDMSERKRRIIRLDYEKVMLPTWLYALVGIDWNLQSPLTDPYKKLKETLGNPS